MYDEKNVVILNVRMLTSKVCRDMQFTLIANAEILRLTKQRVKFVLKSYCVLMEGLPEITIS